MGELGLPASLILSPERCEPGGISLGVPPPDPGDLTSSRPWPYPDSEELGGLWKRNGTGSGLCLIQLFFLVH